MQYDPETYTLEFASPEEAQAFSIQLAALVREAIVARSEDVSSIDDVTKRSKSVMKEVPILLRVLNAVRRATPRSVSE